ncbi:MAG: hypothetical protein EXQ55_02345 [Acidobacteria bacterium]|nr:hypothetical protein [Acidobacteriota bacterium]
MAFRRVFVLLGALALLVATSVPSYAQERKKLSRDEAAQYESLTSLVNAVSAGKQPAPESAKVVFQNHFLRTDTGVYVPYSLAIEPGKLTSFPVGLYVRAVSKSPAPAPAAGQAGRGDAAAESPYAFEDVFFIAKASDIVNRAMQLTPGDYDIHVALLEKAPRDRKIAPKSVMISLPLTVPNMDTGLTTSSVILAKAIEPATAQLTSQQQLEQPYTIGGYKIEPRVGSSLGKAEEFVFVFFVYNEGLAATGKPDVDVDYNFFRAAEAKPFTRLETTSFNATNLTGDVSVAAGLLVGQGIPLEIFAPGDYKLEIKITDKTNSATVTRDVPFTVTP